MIKTKIHSIDVASKNAIISIWDNDIPIINKNNILVELNEDGTVNKEWLMTFTKYTVFHKRLVRVYNNEDDII